MHRRLRTALTTALLSATVLTTAIGVAGPAGAATTPDLLLGVQLHVLAPSSSASDMTRQLDLLADLGATTLRADVSWGSLQQDGPDGWSSWYVDRLDTLVSGANARGMKPVLTLLDSPCWASSAPESLKAGCTGSWWDRDVQLYAPSDMTAYARAAAYVAGRYEGRIAALEVWNEPNYDDQGFSPFIAADRPASYTAMLKSTYPAVKAAAPRTVVLAGALSFSDTDFARALWQRGAVGSYDALSVHPYNGNRAPGTPVDPRYAKYDYTTGLAALHAAQLAAGDTSKLWITEMGWTNCLGTHSWCVSDADQAAYLAQAVGMARQMPYVAAFLSYAMRDNGTVRTNDQHNYGLVRRDYSPKPALAALTAAFRSQAATAPATTAPATTTPAASTPTTRTPATSTPAAPFIGPVAPGTTPSVTTSPGTQTTARSVTTASTTKVRQRRLPTRAVRFSLTAGR